MHGASDHEESRIRIKISAAPDAAVEIGFEPIGTTFTVVNGDWVALDIPAAAAGQIELVSWPNGIAVWLPFPGDYVVFDSSGKEVDRL